MVARLRERDDIDRFVSILGYHLGEQHHHRINTGLATNAGEQDRFRCVPLIFGLLPRSALFRVDAAAPIKPTIREHMRRLGLVDDELLVDVLKDLSDNFHRTGYSTEPARNRPRKATIADLRQQPELYKSIRGRQGGRCACCGVAFGEGPKEETLDHVLPWRLGGDPPGGWNWQLLCKRCNGAKGTLVSALTLPDYQNWIFPELTRTLNPSSETIDEKGRYLVLKYYTQCQFAQCNAGPENTQLVVVEKSADAFAVFDHASVACAEHQLALGLRRLD